MPGTNEAVDAFEFLGERLCLDFVNTLSERPTLSPVELLTSYVDLLAWSRRADLVDERQEARLYALAREQPREAARELELTRRTRELLFSIFRTFVEEQTVPVEDIQQFNELLAEAMRHACLAPGDSGFAWNWCDEGNQLALPLWCIVHDAANLLTSPELARVRICASDDCGWLFLDTSKNHSRRWCDMKSCGNRAKVRRHYERKKGEDKPETPVD